MTVSNQTNRIAAIGNAAIGQEVPFSFGYTAKSDITVYSRVIATGVPTPLAETTNYTLTEPSDTGGTLTTVTAVAATSEIHIIRDTPKTQALDLEAGGSFSAEDVEDALDKNTKLIIENKDSLDRALRAPATDAVALDLELPNSVDRASKNLGFDAGGNVAVTDSEGIFAVATAVWDDVIAKSPWIDIRAYGAVGDDSTDNTAAIQAALTAGEFKTVLIPEGTFKITSALTVPQGTSIVGMGYNSIIRPYSCDGLSFDNSDVISPIRISNFHLWADTGAAYSAIKVMGSADTADRVTGITFDNLYTAWFGTGMNLRSLWFSRIYGCTFNHVWTGINFEGQCVKVSVDKCAIFRGTMAGAGDSKGISIDSAFDYDPGGVTEHRPEDISIDDTVITDFAIGVYVPRNLVVKIRACDLDRQTKYGIEFGNLSGSITIRDNWINITGANALYGIYGSAVAAPTDTLSLLSHNHITATTPHANSTGIYIFSNQDNVTAEHNYINGFKLYDILVDAADNSRILNNSCLSTAPTGAALQVSNSTGAIVIGNRCTGTVAIFPGTTILYVDEAGTISSGETGYNITDMIVCNDNEVVCVDNNVVRI